MPWKPVLAEEHYNRANAQREVTQPGETVQFGGNHVKVDLVQLPAPKGWILNRVQDEGPPEFAPATLS